MLRALLIAFTLAWEAYTILVVSDAGVGFIDVALLVPAAAILAVIWALPSQARGGVGGHRLGRLALWPRSRPWARRSSRSTSRARARAIRSSARASTRASARSPAWPGTWPAARGTPRACGSASSTPATASAMSADEVRFLTTDCGVVDQCGLAYRPRVQPTGARYAHIAGPWYLLYEPF